MRLKQHKWKKWFKDFALNKLRTLHTQFDFSSNVPFMRWMPDQQTVNWTKWARCLSKYRLNRKTGYFRHFGSDLECLKGTIVKWVCNT